MELTFHLVSPGKVAKLVSQRPCSTEDHGSVQPPHSSPVSGTGSITFKGQRRPARVRRNNDILTRPFIKQEFLHDDLIQ